MSKTTRTKKNSAQTNDLDLDAVNAAALQAEQEAAALAELEAQAAADAAELEAIGASAEETIPDEADEAIVADHVPGVFKDMLANVTPEAAQQKAKEFESELLTRFAYETRDGRTIGPSVDKSLKKGTKVLTQVGIAAVFCAIDVDPGFINRSVSEGKRFNVYALDKIADLAQGLGAGFVKNQFDRAILLSMFRCRDAGVPFTGKLMDAACSDKIRMDGALAKHKALMTRHTVAPSTVSTQKSSSIAGLVAMGVITGNQVRGDEAIYSLTDTPQTRRLQEVLLAA